MSTYLINKRIWKEAPEKGPGHNQDLSCKDGKHPVFRKAPDKLKIGTRYELSVLKCCVPKTLAFAFGCVLKRGVLRRVF